GLGIERRLRRLSLDSAWNLARLLELGARVSGREPLLTRYTVAILARTQTYDIRAARSDLGYEPRVSVAEGIERTLAALRAEPVHVGGREEDPPRRGPGRERPERKEREPTST